MKHILSIILFFGFFSSFAQTKVMSYNIRYANSHDGEFSWMLRKDRLAEKLTKDGADILCMQEVLKEQLDFLKSKLSDYSYYGVGRDDGKEGGEFGPIFYKTKRYELLESGTKWLSESPDVVSKGWNAACYRIVTWVVLKDLEYNKNVIVLNTHFDHESALARTQSAMLVSKIAFNLQIDHGKIPTILCGDFNDTEQSPAIKRIMQMFSNTRPRKTEQIKYTYTGFNAPEDQRALIDFIFIRSCNSKDYKVDTTNYDLGQLSDHLSVSCTIFQ